MGCRAGRHFLPGPRNASRMQAGAIGPQSIKAPQHPAPQTPKASVPPMTFEHQGPSGPQSIKAPQGLEASRPFRSPEHLAGACAGALTRSAAGGGCAGRAAAWPRASCTRTRRLLCARSGACAPRRRALPHSREKPLVAHEHPGMFPCTAASSHTKGPPRVQLHGATLGAPSHDVSGKMFIMSNRNLPCNPAAPEHAARLTAQRAASQGAADIQAGTPARRRPSPGGTPDGAARAAPAGAAAAAPEPPQGPGLDADEDGNPSPPALRSPASTPGSQRRRRGGAAARPGAEAGLAARASEPPPTLPEPRPASPARGPNFVAALASFVSGRPRASGGEGDPRGAHPTDGAAAGAGAQLLPPPNVLANTTRPNLLSPAAGPGKAARKAGAAVTWASPPAAAAADADPNPSPAHGQAAAAPPPADANGVWVPDNTATGGGGAGPGGGGGSAPAAGDAAVGAAGHTPHPAGRAVRCAAPEPYPTLHFTPCTRPQCRAHARGRRAQGCALAPGPRTGGQLQSPDSSFLCLGSHLPCRLSAGSLQRGGVCCPDILHIRSIEP